MSRCGKFRVGVPSQVNGADIHSLGERLHSARIEKPEVISELVNSHISTLRDQRQSTADNS